MATKPCKTGFIATHSTLIVIAPTRKEARAKLIKLIWG